MLTNNVSSAMELRVQLHPRGLCVWRCACTDLIVPVYSVHRATTKYFSNSFIFKNKIEKEGLPRDSPGGLGAGGPLFKSGRPDHSIRQIILNVTVFTMRFRVQRTVLFRHINHA